MSRASATRSPRSLKNYAELANNKRAGVVTADDVMTSPGAMLSVFIREPEFQGQTKDKLATARGRPHRRERRSRPFRPLADRPPRPGRPAARLDHRPRR